MRIEAVAILKGRLMLCRSKGRPRFAAHSDSILSRILCATLCLPFCLARYGVEVTMLDLFYIVVALGFFAVCALYVRGCDKL
jgi:hypothetical protein